MKYYIKYKMKNPRNTDTFLYTTNEYDKIEDAEEEYMEEAMARTAMGILDMVYAIMYQIDNEEVILLKTIVDHRLGE